jgi:K(+)-stimulated pyrophosphate-energized sodium pump
VAADTAAGAPAQSTPADATAPAATDAAAALTAKIYFELGKADLPPSAAGDLKPIVDALAQQSGSRAVVSGFHDASGNAQQNAELAKQRAFAVRDALTAAGVAADRIDMSKPAETVGGDDPQQARRVDVTVH